jgi:hypothetical protein
MSNQLSSTRVINYHKIDSCLITKIPYTNFIRSTGDYDTSSRLMRKQLTEKRERLIELERKRLAGIRLEPLRSNQFAYFDCSIEDVHTLSTLPPGWQ